MKRLFYILGLAALAGTLLLCACAATGGKGATLPVSDTLPAAAPETLWTPATAPDAVKAQAPETAAAPDTALLWSVETGG